MPASPELSAFIRVHFRSVWTLELLLFLKKNPASSWSRDALVQALRASEVIIAKSTDILIAGGLIVSDREREVQFMPATDDLARLVDEAQALYASKPDAVRRLIVSPEGAGLSAFADAFLLRKD